ncbi:SDR family NAD(P)-dependent oxidoreductase [Lacticaseibacillus yichunensis]|uniref:SDR family NAD(P)-dependent oxidoreductase n=1 Tax=Lacticaseibacillus yichunensis TaxID=2486015 RepID=A0ABW4CMB3_9LACO|nr:SDR family NAD(P)-dependent oxidoreductase [Lacticaseibacillus yichunensis]
MSEKVVAITGASNGMGLEAAKLFAQRGWIVYGGARRVEKIPTTNGIHALKLDVTDDASRKAFIQTILTDQHRIDVLINNAGYGEYGPLEELPLENLKAQFDVNFFGAAALTQLVLPTMRAQHSGRIVNISSIGEDVFTPLGGAYHATKAALRRWSNVLDQEVKGFGIRSVIVQPGGTQSSWAEIAMANAKKNLKPNSVYRPLVEAVETQLSGLPASAATSADLARLFYRAATDETPKYAYFNTWSDRLMARTARVHPRLYMRIADQLMKGFSKEAGN